MEERLIRRRVKIPGDEEFVGIITRKKPVREVASVPSLNALKKQARGRIQLQAMIQQRTTGLAFGEDITEVLDPADLGFKNLAKELSNVGALDEPARRQTIKDTANYFQEIGRVPEIRATIMAEEIAELLDQANASQ